MAAPTSALYKSFSFRDAKGNISRVRVLIGDATTNAIQTDANALATLLASVSNAAVRLTEAATNAHSYGSSAEYNTVEDKASLAFVDPAGFLHKYQLPAPKSAEFDADQETVNAAETNMAALITAFQTYVYGRSTDTAPLSYVGGIRIRRKLHRRPTIFDKDPTLTLPEE